MTIEIYLALVAAFGAGLIDAMAGGGGLIQLPALFAAFPTAPHTTLLGTGKLAGFAGTASAASRYLRHVRMDWRPRSVPSPARWSARGSPRVFRPHSSARSFPCC